MRQDVIPLPSRYRGLVRSAAKAVLCVALRRIGLHHLVPSSLPQTTMAAVDSHNDGRVRRRVCRRPRTVCPCHVTPPGSSPSIWLALRVPGRVARPPPPCGGNGCVQRGGFCLVPQAFCPTPCVSRRLKKFRRRAATIRIGAASCATQLFGPPEALLPSTVWCRSTMPDKGALPTAMLATCVSKSLWLANRAVLRGSWHMRPPRCVETRSCARFPAGRPRQAVSNTRPAPRFSSADDVCVRLCLGRSPQALPLACAPKCTSLAAAASRLPAERCI